MRNFSTTILAALGQYKNKQRSKQAKFAQIVRVNMLKIQFSSSHFRLAASRHCTWAASPPDIPRQVMFLRLMNERSYLLSDSAARTVCRVDLRL